MTAAENVTPIREGARAARKPVRRKQDKRTIQARLAEAQAELAIAQQKVKTITDEARDSLDFGSYRDPESGYTLSVQHNRTFDKKRAVEVYGEQFHSLQFDQKLAKAGLTGDEFDALYNEGDPKVVLIPIRSTD